MDFSLFLCWNNCICLGSFRFFFFIISRCYCVFYWCIITFFIYLLRITSWYTRWTNRSYFGFIYICSSGTGSCGLFSGIKTLRCILSTHSLIFHKILFFFFTWEIISWGSIIASVSCYLTLFTIYIRFNFWNIFIIFWMLNLFFGFNFLQMLSIMICNSNLSWFYLMLFHILKEI